jgi:NAD(P)-dependent dehydrogenase (short-subunit alcohol dehydrogenase family)
MKTFDINFHGTYRVSKAVLPLMFGQEGVILNMASKAGKSPIAFNGAYGCAKAAVIALTKVMARELAGFGIRVNALCPGLIMTGLQRWRLDLEAQWFQTTPGEREKERSREIPLGYFAEPRVVADLAAFLASRESSYITGQAVNVDGGQLMEI